MTSKTFKSASSERKVRIWEANLGVAVCVEDPITNETTSTQIAPSDAPALALAILEAAGFEDSSSGGHITGARIAVGDLRRHVAKQERITAEAKAQAELEAEALDLFNLWLAGFNYEGYSEWTGENAELKGDWLAVARKSREMRTEK